MNDHRTVLVFGATGRTGWPFVELALGEGYRVRTVVRDPEKLAITRPELEVHQGSVTDNLPLYDLVRGVDAVVVMLGDLEAQRRSAVNEAFMRRLVPAMRRHGVTRLLYQAGGFSTPPHEQLPLPLAILKHTVARRYLGQHRDNEGVMRYLVEQAADLEWIVHRAALGPGDGSRGVLQRSNRAISIATFRDCADYSLRILADPTAIHSCSPSRYVTPAEDAR